MNLYAGVEFHDEETGTVRMGEDRMARDGKEQAGRPRTGWNN